MAGFDAGARSSGGTIDPISVVALIVRSSPSGSVTSSYDAVTMSPSVT